MKFILFTLVLLITIHATYAAFPVRTVVTDTGTPENMISKEVRYDRSGVFGILSFIFAISPITSPLAIVFGIIGMGRHRKNRGLATAGLIVGCIMFLIVGFALFMAYGIPYK